MLSPHRRQIRKEDSFRSRSWKYPRAARTNVAPGLFPSGARSRRNDAEYGDHTCYADETRCVGNVIAEHRDRGIAGVRPNRPVSPLLASSGHPGERVRSAGVRGPSGSWYRTAQQTHQGRTSAGGIEGDVRFAEAGDELDEAVDGAYRRK
jgi:hypothetical protein